MKIIIKKLKKKIKVFKIDFNNLLEYGNCITTSSVTIKKKTFFANGLFDENPSLSGAEDYDLWLRLSKFSKKIIYLDKILGFRSLGTNKFSNNKVQVLKNHIYLANKFKLEIKRLMKNNNLLNFNYTIVLFAFLTKKYNIANSRIRILNLKKLSFFYLIKILVIKMIIELIYFFKKK